MIKQNTNSYIGKEMKTVTFNSDCIGVQLHRHQNQTPLNTYNYIINKPKPYNRNHSETDNNTVAVDTLTQHYQLTTWTCPLERYHFWEIEMHSYNDISNHYIFLYTR